MTMIISKTEQILFLNKNKVNHNRTHKPMLMLIIRIRVLVHKL